MTPDYLKIGKMAAGAGLAITISAGLGLDYSPSAGVIALLSIRDTKKETIRAAVSRVVSFGIALFLAALSFAVLGYRPVAISLFLLFFAYICSRFRMMDGFSANTVLITHFLGRQSMAPDRIVNEVLLLAIGAGLGVLLNLYIPGKEKQIRARQAQVESQMQKILGGLGEALSGTGEEEWRGQVQAAFGQLKRELDQGEQIAFQEMENHLWSDTRYYFSYMNMRKSQMAVLSRMEKLIGHMRGLPVQARLVAEVMEEIRCSFHECNNAVRLLGQSQKVRAAMQGQPLPTEREEFEDRAVLYQILLELEEFLSIKKEFAASLSREEKARFWKMGDFLAGTAG